MLVQLYNGTICRKKSMLSRLAVEGAGRARAGTALALAHLGAAESDHMDHHDHVIVANPTRKSACERGGPRLTQQTPRAPVMPVVDHRRPSTHSKSRASAHVAAGNVWHTPRHRR
jgi:hypothetical protein